MASPELRRFYEETHWPAMGVQREITHVEESRIKMWEVGRGFYRVTSFQRAQSEKEEN